MWIFILASIAVESERLAPWLGDLSAASVAGAGRAENLVGPVLLDVVDELEQLAEATRWEAAVESEPLEILEGEVVDRDAEGRVGIATVATEGHVGARDLVHGIGEFLGVEHGGVG